MGGISAWMPTFLHRSAGLSVGDSSAVVGAITVVDGIAGTLVGGWLAQRWLRTNDRALYLLSFWSVALTLPCGVLLFFGPRAWAIPMLFVTEFFLFLNTGPLERGHCQLGFSPGPRHGHFAQSVLHSLLR
jgi:sugar phosphate permease